MSYIRKSRSSNLKQLFRRTNILVHSILDPNPGRRITATQVLMSEWGKEIHVCKSGEEGF